MLIYGSWVLFFELLLHRIGIVLAHDRDRVVSTTHLGVIICFDIVELDEIVVVEEFAAIVVLQELLGLLIRGSGFGGLENFLSLPYMSMITLSSLASYNLMTWS